MLSLMMGVMVSFAANSWLVRRARAGAHRWDDHDLTGLQKIHSAPVPHAGGIGSFLAVAAARMALWLRQS